MQNKNLLLEELRKLVQEEMSLTPPPSGFLLEEPEVLDEIGVRKNKYALKAVYLFGPAGAGKGFISSSFLGIPTAKRGAKDGFYTSNSDDFVEDIFPAFGIPLKFANAAEGDDPTLEDFQQKVREQIQQWAKNEGVMKLIGAQPILFDTTGENVQKMTGKIKALGKLGYQIGVAQIYVPEAISVQRDQERERTVGANRTAAINQRYQKEVIRNRGYFESLASEPNVHIFGSGVYPNVFSLDPKTGTVGEPLPGVSPEMLEALDINKEKAQAMLDEMRSDAAKFLTMPHTEIGEMLNRAQRKMVKMTGKSGGRHFGSHSLADLELVFTDAFKEEYPEVAADPDIVKAAEYLAKLGGVANYAKSGGVLSKDKKGLDGTLRSQDSKHMIDTDKESPIRVGQEFPRNLDRRKGEVGPNPRQGRSGSRTRVREIEDIVKESVLRTLKDLD